MNETLPLKIGSLYKTTDSMDAIQDPINFAFVIPKDSIVMVLDVNTTQSIKLWFNIELLFENKVGWWNFLQGSLAHKLILENKLLELIVIE